MNKQTRECEKERRRAWYRSFVAKRRLNFNEQESVFVSPLKKKKSSAQILDDLRCLTH